MEGRESVCDATRAVESGEVMPGGIINGRRAAEKKNQRGFCAAL